MYKKTAIVCVDLLVVDYDEYLESLSGKCSVRMVAPKDGVISYEINPPYVECIAEER